MIAESTAWLILAVFIAINLFIAWYAWTDKPPVYESCKPRNWAVARWWKAYKKACHPLTEEEQAEWQPFQF
jgi:hypothetical protein